MAWRGNSTVAVVLLVAAIVCFVLLLFDVKLGEIELLPLGLALGFGGILFK